jgi:DNA-binding PadR family transcriptional regulator
MAERAMQETTFLILTALADQSRHGYAIMTEVERIAHGPVRLRAGTLYTALDRLLEAGLVRIDSEEVVDNRLRRYYALTTKGRGLLAEEAARLRSHAATALRRLRPLGGAS